MSKTTHLPKTLTTVTAFSKLLAVFLIFAFILAGAYAGMVYQHMVDSTVFSTYLTGTITHTSDSSHVITLQDNGKTVPVHVGDIVTFELGSVTQRWSLSFSSNILKRVTLGIMQRVGDEGRYLVLREGTVAVNGIGVANCATGTMCPMYALHFTTTLVATK
ncbi:MAG: hypothetical protein KGJ07_02940 [Patescibacteria group bacterium]|nr:hypothetical protein [Patescibacteria group bacterium]MDE2590726.1 hypothetical protein [Patescibacteria group bacterium]